MPKWPCNAPSTRARSIFSRVMPSAPVRGENAEMKQQIERKQYMIDFISVVHKDTRSGKESKVVLLPMKDFPANLVDYLKKKYRLNDKKFEELLKENNIDIFDPRGGELEIKYYDVCWCPAKAVRKSISGKYISVFSLEDSLLLPLEEMPQAFFSYIKQVSNIPEYEMYYTFFKSNGFCGNNRFPKYGELRFNEKWFSWDEATEQIVE